MTVGISPKVALPAIALLIAGVLLIVVGAIVGNDVVIYIGIGVLGALGIAAPAGYAAPAGAITTSIGQPNDELLPDTARDRLKLT